MRMILVVEKSLKRKCRDQAVSQGGFACRDEGAMDAMGISKCEMGVVAQNNRALRVQH